MNEVTIDLIKLIEQAAPQIGGAVDPLLLQQWLSHNVDAILPVAIDLATVTIEPEAATKNTPGPLSLRPRVSDVITFSDESELHIHVLAPARSREDLATDAYYGLLAAISNV